MIYAIIVYLLIGLYGHSRYISFKKRTGSLYENKRGMEIIILNIIVVLLWPIFNPFKWKSEELKIYKKNDYITRCKKEIDFYEEVGTKGALDIRRQIINNIYK